MRPGIQLVSLLLLGALGVADAASIGCRRAAAQTLDLGGIGEGPLVPEANGAVDLARALEKEAEELGRNAAAMTGEAQARALAVARVRSIAAYLLRGGAQKPWDESAAAVAGARLALLVGRIDGLADRAMAGRDAQGSQLAMRDAQRAIVLLQAIANCPSEPMRRALIAPSARSAEEVTRALATMLAPLAELAGLVEGTRAADPWPVLIDARAVGAEQARSVATASELRERIRMLAVGATRDRLQRSLDDWIARGVLAMRELRMLQSAVASIEWLDAEESEGAPLPMPAPAMRALRTRTEVALAALDADFNDADARAALESLQINLAASRSMLAMRSQPGLNEAARTALEDAVTALLSVNAADATAEQERARTALRIREACEVAERLEKSMAQDAPRDLRESARRLDRDARVAVRALPPAFAALTVDPAAATDPGNLSALERVRSLDADRMRLVLLQGVIDSVGAIKPGAGRAFAGVAVRMARMLEDPLKRSDAQAAFLAVEARYLGSFPLPYEDELKRRTPRAVELADGVPEQVVAKAGLWRAEWCEALGRGDLGGPAAVGLDRVSRLCAALRDLDQMVEPIDRAAADQLATWGPWALRRSMISPATQDLDARAALAVRSFITARDAETFARFERDLLALEQAIPLVRLTAALERRLLPVLGGDAATVSAHLEPLCAEPSANAFLADQWGRLLSLHRALLEAEFARRTANVQYRDQLGRYLADTAREIARAAFGGPRPVAVIPGFDGTAAVEDARPSPSGRRRDR